MPTDVSIYAQQRQPDSLVNQLTGLTGLARQEQAYSADQLALGLRRLALQLRVFLDVSLTCGGLVSAPPR